MHYLPVAVWFQDVLLIHTHLSIHTCTPITYIYTLQMHLCKHYYKMFSPCQLYQQSALSTLISPLKQRIL